MTGTANEAAHIEAAKKFGRTFKRRAADLPPEFFFVWQNFQRLHAQRAVTEAGPQPISWSDLNAYQEVQGERLGGQIDYLLLLDAVYRSEYAKRKPRRTK